MSTNSVTDSDGVHKCPRCKTQTIQSDTIDRQNLVFTILVRGRCDICGQRSILWLEDLCGRKLGEYYR